MKLHRLLIVDDEKVICQGLCDLFPWEDMGFKVIQSFNRPEECLDFLHHDAADVLLTDIRMAGMDGFTLIAKARRLCPALEIVLLSAYTDFQFIQEAMRLGVRDYLTKPVKYQQLCEVFSRIASCLTERQAENDTFQGYYAELLALVRQSIEDDLAGASLQTAAAAASLSPSYVSRLFHYHMQITFSQYLYQQRMKKAQWFLRESTLSIADVAEQVGYNDLKGFSNAFRNFCGLLPSQYRHHVKETGGMPE